MKKILIASAVSLLAAGAHATNFEKVLIANSQKITEIKTQCGGELVGQVRISAKESDVLLYNFALQQSVWGEVKKSCRITIQEDSSLIPVDGPIEYTVIHEKL